MPNVTLNADLSNWKEFSAREKTIRSSRLKAIDQAVEVYRRNKNYRPARIALAKAIFAWLGDKMEAHPDKKVEFQSVSCRQDAVTALMSQMSVDIHCGALTSIPTSARKPYILMPLSNSQNQSMVVMVSSALDCDSYISQVESALRELSTQPYGAALLQRISDQKNRHSDWPYVVRIRSMNNDNKCERILDHQPSYSEVLWDASMQTSQDGFDRPPFIALAHELIHAYHFAVGVNLCGDMEEAATVGLTEKWWVDPDQMDTKRSHFLHNHHDNSPKGDHAVVRITENLIRHEHQVPLRLSYTGLFSLAQTPSALAYAENHPILHSYDILRHHAGV